MPKKRVVKKASKKVTRKNSDSINQGLAIACLIINIFIPGLGSLIGGKIKEGVWQLVIFFLGVFLGILLTITIVGAIIGIPLMILAPLIAWIWGIVTGAKLISNSK